MPKKTEGSLWDFSTSILLQNIKKLKGGVFGEIFFRKMSHNAEKNERGDPLVSSGMVCYAEKAFLVQFARLNDSIWDHKIV